MCRVIHQTLHITYVLLSPTFGMHQYTADLANRMAAAGHQVHLVTTSWVPRDRYSPQVQIVAPVTIRSTGFGTQGLQIPDLLKILATPALQQTDLVHVTGVHLWNVPLVWALHQRRLPVVHTLHDLDPHHGVRFARLIRVWNHVIMRSATHILVHGRRYRAQLVARGLQPTRVTTVPLLHGFWGYGQDLSVLDAESDRPENTAGIPRAVTALFFGRIEQYKGVDVLLAAWRQASTAGPTSHLVLAGQVASDVAMPSLPASVELRSRRIDDAEALALFATTDLVVLPYRDATQSALVAAAYACCRPVLVTRTGALPEYVVEGQTGWIVAPGDVDALAAALQDALADPARLVRMGRTGRIWYNEQRTVEWQTLFEMYCAISTA